MNQISIRHRRQMLQAVLLVLFLALPFLSVHGSPLFRIDVPAHTMFLAGVPLRVDELFILLLSVLLLLVLFFLITVVLGRVWCGWFCPQSLVNDLIESARRWSASRIPSNIVVQATVNLVAISVALLMSLALLLWFMPPAEVFQIILSPRSNPVAWSAAAILFFIAYLDMILVGRDFCRSYCPYGRFQAALTDQSTLNLAFVEQERHRCVRCGQCLQTCPMGIDIRKGFQIECINCGSCIDACRQVMEARNDPQGGLISYRFGDAGGYRIGRRTLVLACGAVLLLAALVWQAGNRRSASMVVRRNSLADVRELPDRSVVVPWSAIIENRAPQAADFRIEADRGVQLLGPVSHIRIPANAGRRIDFFIHRPAGFPDNTSIRLSLVTGLGTVLQVEQVVP